MTLEVINRLRKNFGILLKFQIFLYRDIYRQFHRNIKNLDLIQQ
jgi:hypothetical protein